MEKNYNLILESKFSTKPFFKGLIKNLFVPLLVFLSLFVNKTYGQLPDDFARVELANGLSNTTTFKFAPDGRIFILDRYGELLIYESSVGVPVSAGNLPVFHDLEDGLLGIAFDPNFTSNNYIYIYYSPLSSDYVGNRVSRFSMVGNTLDLNSEITLLQWPTSRDAKFHSGGDMAFDSQGNLYIATGDNVTYVDPNVQHPSSISPDDSDPVASAEKSSSNTNDLRGKILRITPQLNGTYTIPAGNLFSGTPGTLPEIYVMGVRNPYRIFVDSEANDWLYWGEVGPDPASATTLGPAGMDELNLAKTAGNYGWPYFLGTSNEAFEITYASPTYKNVASAPENISAFNTGIQNLPPAVPAMAAFDNRCYLAGFRYYHDPNLTDLQRLPVEFDGKYFFYDFNSSRIWAVELDANGNITDDLSNDVLNLPRFAPTLFPNGGTEGFIDMELGPDGKMYILAYGVPCCDPDAGPTGKLIRVDYTGETTNSPPVIELTATPTNGDLPLVVSFSTAGTTDPNGDSPLSYEWNFGDGSPLSTDPNPTHTYTSAGTYNAQVKVNDGNATNGQSIKNVTIYAGNNQANFIVNSPVDGGLFNWNDDVSIDISVQDPEDGNVNCTDVDLVPGFGHSDAGFAHVHPESTIDACPQLVTLGADGSHGTDGNDDIFASLSLTYEDTGGLIARDLITLHPKRKEAEFFDEQNGTTVIDNNNPIEGGQKALRVNAGGYMAFYGRNLLNMTAVKYQVAATAAGGSIQMRTGSVTGPIIATTVVPATGSTSTWVNVETVFTDPGGKNDLFFVFTGSGSNIFDLNYIEFIGAGTSIDNSAPLVESVKAPSATIVEVKFSEYIDQTTAENIGNYAINNGITITNAVLQPNNQTVALTTSTLNTGTSYSITVSNVENEAGIPVATGNYAFSTFNGVRINSGGPSVTWSGDVFEMDQYNTGGTDFEAVIPIDGTTDDALYQTERYGPGVGTFSYDIPVGSAGEYDIRLHFAEIFFGVGGQAGGAGSRVFNVSIEGNQVLTNFDILSEVAPATALQKEFNNVTVNDGFATIVFSKIVESPKVSGIEVLPFDAFEGSIDADVTITSPSNGWDVNQPFDVAFRVENWTVLEGDTHVHYYIDDMMIGPYYSYEPISIDNLSLGEHTIKIELFNANHTATGIFDEVTVNVTGAITCNTTEFPDQWGVKQLETSSLPHVSVYTFADFDFDGDGLKDIVTGAWWYKNPGTIQGNWVRSDIGNTFNNVVYVHDFDNDGDLDLLGTTGAYQGADLVWAQNDGAGNFTVFSNIPSGNTTYSEPFLAGIAGGVFEVAGPFQMAINWNGAETNSDPMQMLTPSPDPTTGMWSLVTLSPDSTGEDIQVGDIDQDNDLDLFQGTNWLRNDLSTGGGWTTFNTGITYATTPDRAQLADFDRDGDLDAVVGQLSAFTSDPNAGELSWFAAPADPTQPWVRNVIDTDVNGSLSVFATDIDFDGDTDIVVGEWIGDYRLLAFENNLCVDGTFTKRVLNSGIPNQEHHDGARVTDLDNDGDLDVVSNGWFVGGQIRNFPRIYENQTVPTEDDEPIVDAGTDQNILPDTATLNGSASDPDGGLITQYQWTQISGPNTATLSGETTATLELSNLVVGVYVFRLTATDDELDTAFDEVIITVADQLSSIRINAGGPTFNFNSLTWSADQYFNGGDIEENVIDIANTSNDQLYQTERFSTGNLTYEIPVSNGDYNINLHFAEIYYGVPGAGSAGGEGSRIFNVDIENGQGTLTNYDIIAESGAPATAIVENFTQVTVTDGLLTITLTGVVEFPKISGIEVVEFSENNNAPIVSAGDDRSITFPNNSLTLDGSATDPDGGAIVSYSWVQISGPNLATISDDTVTDPTVSDMIEGNYVFELTATDDEGDMASDQVTITIASQPSSLLINSGGPAFDFMTEQWTADNYFVGGTTFEDAIPIANTENDELYQTERFSTSGTLVYEIPVDNGVFNIDLHFAELFYGVGSQSGGVGSRVFDISIENGQVQVDDYDIVEQAGGSATAVVERYQSITVNDGMLTITLTAVTEFPKISGIGVFETRAPDVDAGPDQTIIIPDNSVVLNGSGSDSDGGEVTYEWTQISGPNTATLAGADTADLAASGLIEGVYVFRLTITDDELEVSFDEATITVAPEGGINGAPTAVAEADPLSGPASLLVNFTGSNSTDDNGVISYLWDFGDGTTSTEADPQKIYAVPGVFTVQLTVTDEGGLTSSATITVTVEEDPAGKMNVILESNPPNPADGGVARILIINKPVDLTVLNITLHDVGGRYIEGYIASDIENNGIFELPTATLRDGLYFVRVALNQGETTLIKLWVRN